MLIQVHQGKAMHGTSVRYGFYNPFSFKIDSLSWIVSSNLISALGLSA